MGYQRWMAAKLNYSALRINCVQTNQRTPAQPESKILIRLALRRFAIVISTGGTRQWQRLRTSYDALTH